jgi:hypothetical protein
MDKTPPGQIIDGDAEEKAASTELGDVWAEQAWAGLFSGGKEIIATETWFDMKLNKNVLTFSFSDGSAMSVVGNFDVRFKPAGASDVIDAEVVREDDEPAALGSGS